MTRSGRRPSTWSEADTHLGLFVCLIVDAGRVVVRRVVVRRVVARRVVARRVAESAARQLDNV